MDRNSFVTLTIIAFGLSLLGCQSDAQKMHKGLAREYQDRYNNCTESVQNFIRYAGFGFVDELGVCQCNEKICQGTETCDAHGRCSGFNPEPECKENAKICISPTIGQICKMVQGGLKWSEPLACPDNKVCNPELAGAENICAPSCSGSICSPQKNGAGIISKCIGGEYGDETPCKNNGNLVSCADYDKCGECLNNTMRCIGDKGSPQICINGQWAEIKDCILCEDDKCYNQQQCVEKTDKSGYEVMLTTDKGKQRVKEECENGCDANLKNCADNVIKPPCVEGTKRCDINAMEICNNGGWNVERFCNNGCNSEKTACNPECKPGTIECQGNILRTCTLDENWDEQDCGTAGCNATSKKCEVRCPDYCPDTCDADGKCNLECSCQGHKVSCKFGDGKELVQNGDVVNNINHCLHQPSDGYFCGNEDQDVTLDRCCIDGENYCFNGDSYYCRNGKFEQDSNCSCTGSDIFFENPACSDIPPDPACNDDFFYICERNESSSEEVIKQCMKTEPQNCTVYTGNDKKVLSIHFPQNGSETRFETCGGNKKFSMSCGVRLGLYGSLPEMEKTKCTSNPSSFSGGTNALGCDCSSAVGIESGWYYMMVDEKDEKYNSRIELYLSVGIDDGSNQCSVYIGPEPSKNEF